MKDRALFLDRDGTIIVENEFNADPERVELIPGAVAALLSAMSLGFKLFIVTNQSGVARGMMTVEDVESVNRRVLDHLNQGQVKIAGIYYCPHYPPITGPCDCRKPNRGMIDQALRSYDLDLSRSYVIGDRTLDMELAFNIGAHAVMVTTGYGAEESRQFDHEPFPDYIARDISDAVEWIKRNSLT